MLYFWWGCKGNLKEPLGSILVWSKKNLLSCNMFESCCCFLLLLLLERFRQTPRDWNTADLQQHVLRVGRRRASVLRRRRTTREQSLRVQRLERDEHGPGDRRHGNCGLPWQQSQVYPKHAAIQWSQCWAVGGHQPGSDVKPHRASVLGNDTARRLRSAGEWLVVGKYLV